MRTRTLLLALVAVSAVGCASNPPNEIRPSYGFDSARRVEQINAPASPSFDWR